MADPSTRLSEADWALLRRPETKQAFYERAASVLVHHGAEHWCCRFPDVVRELLWLWQFGNQPTVQWLQSRLDDQLGQGCFACVLSLHSSREEALQGLDADKFEEAVDVWDSSRLHKKLSALHGIVQEIRLNNKGDWHESIQIQQLLCSMLEVLMRPRLLRLSNLNESFKACLLELLHPSIGGEGLSISAGRWLAGVYYLCGHQHERIRSWARRQIAALGVIEDLDRFAELEPVIEDYLTLLGEYSAAEGEDESIDGAGAGTRESVESSSRTPFSKHPREVWMGLLAVLRQVHPTVLQRRLLPRFPSLLSLTALTLLSGGAALFPAVQCLHHLLSAVGRELWPHCPAGCSPSLLWDALEVLACGGGGGGGGTVPVQKAALEALPALFNALAGHVSDSEHRARAAQLMEILCGRRLRQDPQRVPAATRTIATQVALRFLHGALRRGGPAALPLHSTGIWVQHVLDAGMAAPPAATPAQQHASAAAGAVGGGSATAGAAVRAAATAFVDEWLAAQAATLENLVRAPASSLTGLLGSCDLVAVKEMPWARGGVAEAFGEAPLGDEAEDGSGFCESLWASLIINAELRLVPMLLHVRLLRSCSMLFFWHAAWPAMLAKVGSIAELQKTSDFVTAGKEKAEDSDHLAGHVSGNCVEREPNAKNLSENPERSLTPSSKAYARFVYLGLHYLSRLARDKQLATSILRESLALEATVGLLWTAHSSARDAAAAIISQALDSSGSGAAQALELATIQQPQAVAASILAACCRMLGLRDDNPDTLLRVDESKEEVCSEERLDGPAFGCLSFFFLFAGQAAPSLLSQQSSLPQNVRGDLCRLLWQLADSFIRARIRFRRPVFDRRHGPTALEAAAARFFPFLRGLWPYLQHVEISDSSDEEDDESSDLRSGRVIDRHVDWLPPLAKWGGISSPVVRRHWCECVSTILESIGVAAKGENGTCLTTKEQGVFETLLARRDLWSDSQLLALGRSLGPLGLSSIKTDQGAVIGVGGYGNLGVSPLAGLPLRGLPSSKESAKAEIQKSGKKGKRARTNFNSSVAVETSDSDDRPLQKRMNKRLPREGQRNLTIAVKKKRLLKDNETTKESSATADLAEVIENKTVENGTALLRTHATVSKEKRRAGSNLVDLAASAAAVHTGNLNCVMVKIGGIEIQVPILSRGEQNNPNTTSRSRPVKTVAELEDDMHRIVLAWDITAGPDALHRLGTTTSSNLLGLPKRYSSLDEYEDRVAPLLLRECLEQLCIAYQEHGMTTQVEDAVCTMCNVVDCNDCGLWTFVRLEPSDGGSTARSRRTFGDGNSDGGLLEGDVVLLEWAPVLGSSEEAKPLQALGRAAKNSSWLRATKQFSKAAVETEDNWSRVSVLALVERRGRDQRLPLKLFLHGDQRLDIMRKRLNTAATCWQSARTSEAGKNKEKSENVATTWRIVPLHTSLSTSEREFIAVHNLRAFPQYVQAAILDPLRTQPQQHYDKLRNKWPGSATLNHSQQDAIAAALDRSQPFTLIQGPPGSGKTRTIVSLIAEMLSSGSSSDGAGGGWNCNSSRILVCAPSNAAVDEIATRLLEGLGSQSEFCSDTIAPLVVRVGPRGQMRTDVWDKMSLDKLAEKEFRTSADRSVITASVAKGRDDTEAPGQEAVEAQTENLAAQSGGGGRVAALRALCRVKEAETSAAQKRDRMRAARARVLSRARVICTTLSGAGSAALRGGGLGGAMLFDAVVIDEAAQAVEASALIPLPLLAGCGGAACGRLKCVLVGDPQQLPATVISQAAAAHGYGRSLFERLQAAGHEPVLLSVQYRMHPLIRAFPSNHFYGGLLTDGFSSLPDDDGILRDNIAASSDVIWHRDIRFQPLVVYNIPSTEHRSGAGSVCNFEEAACCSRLLTALADCMGATDALRSRVAILTPYRKQVQTIRESLSAFSLPSLEVCTVDSFQGREADIIVLSCVRGSSPGGIGFVADIRRMNVALTRARKTLVVLCNAASLCQNEHWNAFLEHARRARCCIYVEDGSGECIFGKNQDQRKWQRENWPPEMLDADSKKVSVSERKRFKRQEDGCSGTAGDDKPTSASKLTSHNCASKTPLHRSKNISEEDQATEPEKISSTDVMTVTARYEHKKSRAAPNIKIPKKISREEEFLQADTKVQQPSQVKPPEPSGESDNHIMLDVNVVAKSQLSSTKHSVDKEIGADEPRGKRNLDFRSAALSKALDERPLDNLPHDSHKSAPKHTSCVVAREVERKGFKVKVGQPLAADQKGTEALLNASERSKLHTSSRFKAESKGEGQHLGEVQHTGEVKKSLLKRSRQQEAAEDAIPQTTMSSNAATAGTSEALPEGWSKQWSKSWGKEYFFNEKTGEQRWEAPQRSGAAEDPAISGSSGGEAKPVDSVSAGHGHGTGGSGHRDRLRNKGDPGTSSSSHRDRLHSKGDPSTSGCSHRDLLHSKGDPSISSSGSSHRDRLDRLHDKGDPSTSSRQRKGADSDPVRKSRKEDFGAKRHAM